MSDEIKEILDNLIVNETTGLCYLSKKLTKQVEDCITNLQQELERYKHYSKTTGIEELMQENEYLKKHQRFHKKFGNDYIFCVEGNKETYKDLLLEKQEELEDYKSRVEKAIEAINTQLKNAEGGYKDNLRIIKFNLIKGSCTFEDLKTEDDYKYDGGKDE